MLTMMLFPFMALAVLGLALSLMVHVAAWLGIDLPFEAFGLHVGVFVVWVPALLASRWTARHHAREDFWSGALRGCPLRGCPGWMRLMTYGFVAYAVFNFVSAFVGTPATPTLRAFSGHWMAFYAAAFAVLYSTMHTPYAGAGRRCPLGHFVARGAKYCDQCGMLVN
jgi:hypothetical protein